MTSKKLILLIGLPASGKSTRRSKLSGYVHVSTDDLIEEGGRMIGQTYDQVFSSLIDDATKIANIKFAEALRDGLPVVVDRTNLTPKARAPWIAKAKNKGYEVYAVNYKPPMTDAAHAEWNRRLASRPGKTIPDHVLVEMFCNYKPATHAEGFDSVFNVNTFEGNS